MTNDQSLVIPLGKDTPDLSRTAGAIGNKGRLLHIASAGGLPVPRGFILTHEFFESALNSGAVRQNDTKLILANRDSLMASLPKFSTKIAVRSAFSAEDTSNSSMAGYFKSFLFVPAEETPDRLLDVWQSSMSFSTQVRRDVLFMEMVDAKTAGVAFSERNYEDDLVNYSDGTADKLVSGHTQGVSLYLPRLRSFESESDFLNAHQSRLPFATRLARMLRDARTIFADKDWDIEWADDGLRCWLIQIRPVTVASRRNECFTIANHKEILPDLPSPFMTSLIASCSYDLLCYYRQFDPELPDGRPFVEVFKGRPYINLSFLTEMMRHWGLPTTLVTHSIGGTSDRQFALNPQRLGRKLPVLARMFASQLASVQHSQQCIQSMHQLTDTKPESFAQSILILQSIYKTLVKAMFSLTSAMSGPLAMTRKLGVLEEHNSRHETIAGRMYKELESLRRYVAAHPEISADLEQGTVPDDAHFQTLWQDYLERHGHRGVYESDIARPRMRERPEIVLKGLVHALPPRNKPPSRTLLGIATIPVWWQASRTIKAREKLRYNAMKCFERLRTAILELAQEHLHAADDIWLLNIDEVAQLDGGWLPSIEFLTQRKRELDELSAYRLPDLLHRFDDLDEYSSQCNPNQQSKLRGTSLTTGKVSGKALVLMEPTASLPAGYEPATTILVARSVDAGWIPTFALVRAVVVEIGGDLSHGSIILRETGIPAITNVSSATRLIRDGDQLNVDASTGSIELIQE